MLSKLKKSFRTSNRVKNKFVLHDIMHFLTTKLLKADIKHSDYGCNIPKCCNFLEYFQSLVLRCRQVNILLGVCISLLQKCANFSANFHTREWCLVCALPSFKILCNFKGE